MLTTEQIEARLNSIDIKIKGLILQLDRISAELNGKSNITDFNRTIREIEELIKSNAIVIQALEEKLSKVLLPKETRFYLEEGEVSNFQSNFNTLKAMMTKLDKLYKNLIAYQANLTSGS